MPRDDDPARAGNPILEQIEVPDLGRLSGGATRAGDMLWVTLDHPTWRAAAREDFMRDDDLVFGVVDGDATWCVPFFIVDYYHSVNTDLCGEPVVFVSCDACASAGAWRTSLDGRRLTFRNWGILGGQMIWRDDETHSLWLHSEAAAFAGDLTGAVLDPFGVVIQCEWRDWREWYPDTQVLAPVQGDIAHADMRHGHGREEFFERRGIGLHERDAFLASTDRPWDMRRPEHEMVVGINDGFGVRTYPWRELKRDGNVVNDVVGDTPVVVWCDPRPDRFASAAFLRTVAGAELRFDVADPGAAPPAFYVDRETGSTWDIAGRCRSGPLTGEWLTPARGVFKRWYSWSTAHHGAEIHEAASGPSALWPHEGDLEPALTALRGHGVAVTVLEELPLPTLPAGVVRGLVIEIDGHRFWLLRTAHHGIARDLTAFAHEWQDPQHTIAAGILVLKDETEARWEDWAHARRRPDDEVAWSTLLDDEGFRAAFARAAGTLGDGSDAGRALRDVVAGLAERGFPTVPEHARLLPRSSGPPGCEAAVELRTADDERFVLYACNGEADAARIAASYSHTMTRGRFTLRDTPLNMYRQRLSELALRGERGTRWSPLIADERFVAAFADAVDARPLPEVGAP